MIDVVWSTLAVGRFLRWRDVSAVVGSGQLSWKQGAINLPAADDSRLPQ